MFCVMCVLVCLFARLLATCLDFTVCDLRFTLLDHIMHMLKQGNVRYILLLAINFLATTSYGNLALSQMQCGLQQLLPPGCAAIHTASRARLTGN